VQNFIKIDSAVTRLRMREKNEVSRGFFCYQQHCARRKAPVFKLLGGRFWFCRFYFIPILSGIEPWLMARWKVRVEFLLSVIELLFLSLALEALQGKMCQNSLPSGQGRSLGAKISGGGEGVVPLPIYW